MSKKIGAFLMIVLVIWAVLLLDATKNRRPARPETDLPTATTAPMESTAPQTVPPQTAESVSAPAPTEPAMVSQVQAILDRSDLDRTAVTHRVSGGPASTTTAILAELAARREMNPIAAFWLLLSEGLYERDGKQEGLPQTDLPVWTIQGVKGYPYTDAGAAELLTDLLTLADWDLPGEADAVEAEQVSHSEKEGCRYAYFARTTADSTGILCFYLRGDARGEWIEDVEFQLLHMTCGSVPQDGQAAALAAAVELLMTGTTRTGEPAGSYTVGGWTAAAERLFYTAEAEQGILTNYRLRNQK